MFLKNVDCTRLPECRCSRCVVQVSQAMRRTYSGVDVTLQIVLAHDGPQLRLTFPNGDVRDSRVGYNAKVDVAAWYEVSIWKKVQEMTRDLGSIHVGALGNA